MKKNDRYASLTFEGEIFQKISTNGRKRLFIKVICDCGNRFAIGKNNWKRQKKCSTCNQKDKAKVTPLIKGEVFGNLTATGKTKAELHDHLKTRRTVKFHELKCKCGDVRFYRENSLKTTKKCMFCHKADLKNYSKTHGMTNTLEYRIFSTSKTRAKKRNLDFNLELDDIFIPDFCPVLNIKIDKRLFKHSKRRPLDNSATLDRIDSSKGYIKGNIAVISYLANSIKNEGNADEHDAIATFIENHER